MKFLFFLLFLICSQALNADEIDKVFSDGIFGTVWGQSPNEVLRIYPSGKKEELYGSLRITVEDGREVLGIPRPSDGNLVFAFDTQDRLFSIGVTFGSEDDFAKLMQKIDTLFGARENLQNDTGAAGLVWNDDQTKLSLIYVPGMFSGETILSIEHLALPKNNKSKEELGF